MHDCGKGALGGKRTKPHLAPKAPNPEGRKTVVWAENLENVVGEGAGCGSDDSDDGEITELTTPAPREGVEGGRKPGDALVPHLNPPLPYGRWSGGRNT